MATRSTISIELNDGTVKTVYCHWDGYLSHNGYILLKHYSNTEKLLELIELGDLSVLGQDIGHKHLFDNPHKYGSPEYNDYREMHKNMCTFYGRDRGEDGISARVYSSYDDYVANSQGEEYNYILRACGKWLVEFQDTNGKFVELSEAIAKEEAENAEVD